VSTTRFRADNPELDAFYRDIAGADLQPLWELTGLLTPTPQVRARPFRWRAGDLWKLAQRSGELVPIERGGDRRVLALANPGLGGAPFVSASLWAAVQFLQPGEVAPAHRHSPAALRFVLDGGGVYTLLNGDPVVMHRGDLVLTPSWTFHEHHNPSPDPMMWLDVLDLPLVAALDSVFFEEGPSEVADQAVAPRSAAERRYGQGAGLQPAGVSLVEHTSAHSPLTVYRWADTDAALAALLEIGDADEAMLRYRDPVRDRDVMPTLRCEMRRLRAGATTAADRQTGTRVCAVFDGTGSVNVGDQTYDLGVGDIFVVPSWATHCLHADSTLDIFATSDAPVLEALGLYRSEQAAP
jgi:gentisate 1,2-dioxygenase